MYDGSAWTLFAFHGSEAGSLDSSYAGVGLTHHFGPAGSVTLAVPHRSASGWDSASLRDVAAGGLGDVRLGASWYVRHRERSTGDSLGANGLATGPAVTLAFELSAPTGSADEGDSLGVFPARYQPGAGVWIPSVSASWSHATGRLTPGLRVAFDLPAGENAAGYERSRTVTLDVDCVYRSSSKPGRRIYASLVRETALDDDSESGSPIVGSAGSVLRLEAGIARRFADNAVFGLNLGLVVSDSRTADGFRAGGSRQLGLAVSTSF